MNEPIDRQVEQVIQRIKDNPVHMRKHVERVKKCRKNSEHWNTSPRRTVEEEMFDDSEDITVYVDFCGGIFPHTEPLEERREMARHFLHAHDFFEMMYVYSGVCYCYFDQREYTLPKGSIWIFNTQCAHSVVVPNDGSTLINILLRKSTFSTAILDMIQDNDLFLNFFLKSIHNTNNLPHRMQFLAEPGSMIELYLFKIIIEYAGCFKYRQKIMKLMLSALLTELARDYQQRDQEDESKENGDILHIISYISDHYNEVTLKSLSEQFHYSADYLSKLIEKYTGYTFSEYIRRYKFNRAAYLIKNSGQSIEQISLLTGYSLRSSFDREFKKYFGLTPKQYQKEQREREQ